MPLGGTGKRQNAPGMAEELSKTKRKCQVGTADFRYSWRKPSYIKIHFVTERHTDLAGTFKQHILVVLTITCADIL